MNEPHWLNQEIILAIHTQLLARFGGLEGLRDEGCTGIHISPTEPIDKFWRTQLVHMAAGEIAHFVWDYELMGNHPRVRVYTRVDTSAEIRHSK